MNRNSTLKCSAAAGKDTACGVTGVKTDGMQLLTAGGYWKIKTKALLAGGF